ncbi:hypothetical protein OROMI_026468 [Orobanche minor]
MEINDELGAAAGTECCMCGDYGLSSQLVKCNHCRFRSQHRYCSNLYPEATSYDICNWCLVAQEKDNRGEGNIMKISPNKTTSDHYDHKEHGTRMKKNKKRVLGDSLGSLRNNKTSTGGDQIKIKLNEFPAERSDPSVGTNKKLSIEHGGGEIGKRIIRRTRSEEISNSSGIMVKPVFKNKVRRYKLLDEVSC